MGTAQRPDPTEAVVNLLRDVLENHEPAPDLALEVRLSVLEPPSALLALRSAFPLAAVAADAVPDPDLRQPTGDVRHAVWRYDGVVALPAVPPPSPEPPSGERVQALRAPSAPAPRVTAPPVAVGVGSGTA